MTYVKAWVVDPFARRISRVVMEQDSLDDMYMALSSPAGYPVDCITCAGEFANRDAVIIDDNGKLHGGLEKQQFFMLNLDGFLQLIAGRALIVGTGPEGETVDASSDMFEVANHVAFPPAGLTESLRRVALDEAAQGPVVFIIEGGE